MTERMTIEDVSNKYGVSISSLKNMFPRTQASIYKKTGDRILKFGRGASAYYEIEENDCRALTMYEEPKNELVLDDQETKLPNFDFIVFLAIVTTPMLVFRGSYSDFLRYIAANVTKENIELLKLALESLVSKNLISYTIDKTNKDWFVAALYREVETKLCVEIRMVKMCKKLAEEHNKRSWVPLLKTWIGVQKLSNNQPYTVAELCEFTGLSEYQIRESKKILESEDIFKTSRAYSSFIRCLGTNVDLNAFYN